MIFFKDIFNLFFPKECITCRKILVKNEELLCITCRFELPLTEISNIANNIVEKVFYGRVQIVFATSLLFYKRKNITQKLIHQLKYKGKEDVGIFLGKWLGEELKSCDRLPKIDVVVPVPITKRKLKTRGYNQVSKFAQTLADILSISCDETVLISIPKEDTQTLKQRLERWTNVEDKFQLTNNTDSLIGKNILLVDDVITTGATLEACAIELQKIKGVKISIASMAFTS